MWDILYYLAGISAAGTVGFGLLYFYDRDSEFSTNISWNAVKAYHKANLEIDNFKKWFEYQNSQKNLKRVVVNDYNDDSRSNTNIEFIGYNSKDDTTYTSFQLEDNEYINDTHFELMFLKKKVEDDELYKRITDKNDINENQKFNKIDKPFIQVELCQGENKVTIHQKLSNFYVVENMLLDKVFLNWYLTTFYSIILDDNYDLSIIDSDINMFKLQNGEYVILNPNKKYDVKNL